MAQIGFHEHFYFLIDLDCYFLVTNIIILKCKTHQFYTKNLRKVENSLYFNRLSHRRKTPEFYKISKYIK